MGMVRGIFWKIFLAFWLANLMALGGTALVVIHSLESRNIKDRHQQFIKTVAVAIAERYEISGRRLNGDAFTRLVQNMPLHNEMMWRRPFRIIDENSKPVFQNGPRRAPPGHSRLQFEVRTAAGNRYSVETFFGPPPRFIIDGLRRINFFQFILVLIASALVSLLLSWNFARPLKALGAFSRRYAGGEGEAEIDGKLLRRGDEIGDLARDLAYMSAQVEKNINSQKQLLHDVSHELRSPLARLQAVAGLLQQKESGLGDDLDKIHRECERIDGLLQQILNFSRVEQVHATAEEVEIVALVKTLRESVGCEYPHRVIEVNSAKSAVLVKANRAGLEAAVDNVLRNACKYSPATQPVHINITVAAVSASITVRDFGAGVQAEELDKLVTPFYRSHNTKRGEGYGLGLSIAHRATVGLGGELELSNHPQGGFVATLKVPRAC